MNANDREYFLRRASEEEEAAGTSLSLAARWRHEELASLYRMRVLAFDRSAIDDNASEVAEPFILIPGPSETEAA
ncbi:MAG TPA: hypothetical protein VJ775_05555 [Sphingomicrobium sp.]|nr:hypothetical protein [Sphingomicrobium sp.]